MKRIGLLILSLGLGLASGGSLAAERLAVLVIPQEKFQDRELKEARDTLTAQGVKVLIAAPEVKPVKGMLGQVVIPDMAVENLNPELADLVAVIGGAGSVKLWDNPFLLDRLRAVHARGRPVAAICLASGVLAKAGLLKGLKATCFPLEKAVQLLKESGAEYRTEPVVVDGLVITGNGPEASGGWAKELLSAIMAVHE